jgi:signal transduction histidine kinase
MSRRIATNGHRIRPAEHPLDAILATTSHELTAPLAVLAGSLQLAERWVSEASDDVTPAQRQRMDALGRVLRLANQQVGRMNRLVDDLRDSAGIQAGKLRMCFEPADLVELVASVVTEQRLLHPCRVFHVALPESESVIATVDVERIRQVLSNYLINAVKYTPAERPIEIRLQIHASIAHVSVRDHGPGLAPHRRKCIWERFQQAHTLGGDGEASGLGLGLHISRTIVEQHQGCVGVESVLGQGATFWFEIPLERTAPP